MELPADSIDHLLDTWPVARLATIAPSGRPHQVPVVFARSRGRLWSPVDAKPKREGELARVRNLRARPAASLLLDHYDERWERLWWLRLDVRGEIVEPRAGGDPAVAEALERLRAKYPQYREVPLLRERPQLLALEPVSISSWCAGRDALPVR